LPGMEQSVLPRSASLAIAFTVASGVAPGSPDAGGAAAGGPPAGGGGSEVSPLVIDGVRYLTTSGRKAVALEPETGKGIWTYDVTDGAPTTRGLE
jgi:glucose dehydrogenase